MTYGKKVQVQTWGVKDSEDVKLLEQERDRAGLDFSPCEINYYQKEQQQFFCAEELLIFEGAEKKNNVWNVSVFFPLTKSFLQYL